MQLSLELNPRPGKGVYATPLSFFFAMHPELWADRAEILDSLWGILCATFGKKKYRVMSGHGAMTSQEVHTRSGHFCEK